MGLEVDDCTLLTCTPGTAVTSMIVTRMLLPRSTLEQILPLTDTSSNWNLQQQTPYRLQQACKPSWVGLGWVGSKQALRNFSGIHTASVCIYGPLYGIYIDHMILPRCVELPLCMHATMFRWRETKGMMSGHYAMERNKQAQLVYLLQIQQRRSQFKDNVRISCVTRYESAHASV
jgi:hypothetical protein